VCPREAKGATRALACSSQLSEKVRPGGDAGLVRPTYPELALGGTTLGAKPQTPARANPIRLRHHAASADGNFAMSAITKLAP
jgi:hypothetical protein